MTRDVRCGRSTQLGIMLVVALWLGGVAPRFGFAKTVQTPLWTERPIRTPAERVPSPWVQLARDLMPAVVTVSVARAADLGPRGPSDGGDGVVGDGTKPSRRSFASLGSGFVINPKGYVVTNEHVVDGAAEIHVRLLDGREFLATVIGRGADGDLALLKIEATGHPTPKEEVRP